VSQPFDTRILRAGWLLAGLSAFAAQADLGPALSGLTARASNATTVFTSPAGITRLDQPELIVQATLAVTASKFEVDESNISGGSADNDTTLMAIPAFYYAHPINDRWTVGAAPLDRVIAVGAGVEWQWKGFQIHNTLNYADLGDGNLDQDNGLAGRVRGSFDRNYAVVLDTQVIKRF